MVYGTTFWTISERLKRVRTKVWLFVCCDFATIFSRANVCHKNFGSTVKKYTHYQFSLEKHEVSKAILKNFGTLWTSTAYTDSAQRSSLRALRMLEISVFGAFSFQKIFLTIRCQSFPFQCEQQMMIIKKSVELIFD